MASDPAGTLRCTHCKRLYLSTPGSVICPHCKRTIEAVQKSEPVKADKPTPTGTRSTQMRPQTLVCTVCGGDRLKRAYCLRCLGTGAHTPARPAPEPQLPKHSFKPAGKPSDHRPDGTAVCFICDGRGSNHNRTCSKCGGRGYLGSVQSEAPRVLEPNAAPNRALVATTNPYAAKPMPEPGLKNTLAPWYMTTPPHPSTCISCNGQPSRKKCPRCKGTGRDPWAMDQQVEQKARDLFEEGWRPTVDTPTRTHMHRKEWMTGTVSLEVWMTLHQLCVEEQIAMEESDPHNLRRRAQHGH